MGTTTQRQEAAVRRLATAGILTTSQADVVLTALREAAAPSSRQRGWWFEILGYVGGGLMLAGAATLVGLSWEDLTRAAQVALLGAVALALLGAATAVAGGPARVHRLAAGTAQARRRVVGVLLALAAGPTALAAGVAVDGEPAVLPQLAGLVAAAGTYAWLRTAPGLLAAAFFSASTAGTAVEGLRGDTFTLALAAALVAVGAGWIGLSLGGLAVPRDLGLAVGAGVTLFGAQQPMAAEDIAGWAYAGTLAVAVACLALDRLRRSLVLLAAGVIGVTVAIPELVWDLTDGAGGAAAIPLIGGAVLLGAGGAGLWLHRSPTHRPT
jgi:hypothetical protein